MKLRSDILKFWILRTILGRVCLLCFNVSYVSFQNIILWSFVYSYAFQFKTHTNASSWPCVCTNSLKKLSKFATKRNSFKNTLHIGDIWKLSNLILETGLFEDAFVMNIIYLTIIPLLVMRVGKTMHKNYDLSNENRF